MESGVQWVAVAVTVKHSFCLHQIFAIITSGIKIEELNTRKN